MHTNEQAVQYLHLNGCYQLNHFTTIDSHATKLDKMKNKVQNDTSLIANARLDQSIGAERSGTKIA